MYQFSLVFIDRDNGNITVKRAICLSSQGLYTEVGAYKNCHPNIDSIQTASILCALHTLAIGIFEFLSNSMLLPYIR